MSSVAFVAMVSHFIFETARLGQIMLYAQVTLFTFVLPFHFIGFFRARMKSSLGAKTEMHYRNSGKRKLMIAVIMIILPFIIPY